MARLLEIPPGDALVTRDRAIMELLYSSGLRLAELVGLIVGELELADRTVRVLGKGRQDAHRAGGHAGPGGPRALAAASAPPGEAR